MINIQVYNVENKQPTIRPFTSTIVVEVMDFEIEKYKCRVLLRLVGTVEGFHWFRFTEFIGQKIRGGFRLVLRINRQIFFRWETLPLVNLNIGGKLLTSGSPLPVVHAHVITSGDVTAPPQIRLELCPYTTFVACAIYIIYCIHYSLPIKSWKNYIQKCKLEPY